ncbi:MAG: preprotein translocase subunit SecA [Chloroflexi bacterium]|nr:preprotein translocase subunit SecA [Chloroflexota bacterium]
MFKKALGSLFDSNEREVNRLRPIVATTNELEPAFQALSDAELRAKTDEFRDHLADGEMLDDLLPDAFAAVREAARRTIGQRHYDVQLMAGIVLHQSKIAEQRTGEGKTLTASLPLYLNALLGRGAHLITPNDYLSRVGGGWMGPIYHRLGLSIGVISHDFAGLYDPDYVDPSDHGGDSRLMHWRPCERREAYLADVTYGTNNEFGFDYLRDNMVMDLRQRVQRDLYYAIVDEVDNILVDEARTPLIISGPAEESTNEYVRFARIVPRLRPEEDFEIDEKMRVITLTEEGMAKMERWLGVQNLYDSEYNELTYYLENALKAEFIFHRDHNYVVLDGQVVIVDEFTGRLMHGRRYSEGLHQAIEAKEGVKVQRESLTWATITFQNYFRMYDKLAGMTGTAATEKEEFFKIYGLDVVVLPTHRPMVRQDHTDMVYKTQTAKFRAVVDEIDEMHHQGQPVLVGTVAVETSEMLGQMLKRQGVPHHVLNAKLHEKEAFVIAQAGRPGAVTIATNMAGRGVDILLGGNPDGLAADLLERRFYQAAQGFVRATLDGNLQQAHQLAQRTQGLTAESIALVESLKGEYDAYHKHSDAERGSGRARFIVNRLLESGRIVPEQARIVLDLARAILDEDWPTVLQMTTEDRVVPEELVAEVKLLRADYEVEGGDVEFVARRLFARYYNTMIAVIRHVLDDDLDQARQVVAQHPELSEAVIAEIQTIKTEWQRDQDRVRELGGLHIVGTERHEARRIDNQLRGRAGRQGDPGSSRFYVSLEDDLMRRFGGSAVASVMDRFGLDEDIPIEAGLVSKTIENSQVKVEGYNFDIRKHVVEYDDVMNTQREVIYDQRTKVLSADNLRPIIEEMVLDEVDDLVGSYLTAEVDEEALVGFLNELQRIVPLPPDWQPASLADLSVDEIGERAAALVTDTYDDREREITSPLLRQVERHVLLRAMDNLWVRHLTALDALREGIGLRAYGQQNPLVVYKKEAHEMFQELLGMIRHDTTRAIFHVRVQAQSMSQPAMPPPARRPATPRRPAAQPVAAAAGGAPQPTGKVGRNDPCPCGSGKKYKKCCGR